MGVHEKNVETYHEYHSTRAEDGNPNLTKTDATPLSPTEDGDPNLSGWASASADPGWLNSKQIFLMGHLSMKTLLKWVMRKT
jgi:hypothetical protein